MSESFVRVTSTREEAHQAVMDAYAVAKLFIADGRRVRIEVAEDLDPLTVKQRKFLHGPVLQQISEQVLIEGRRYARGTWKEFYRSLLLGSRFEVIAGRTIEIRNSTEDLSVRHYSEYIEQVLAHAATEFGVEFHFRQGEREACIYRAKAPATKERETC